MNSRILLKEIPYGKFHSAIFTTYSFNFYYFEQQVLQLLGSKGIHYISVLADANMLNNQFDSFSTKSDNRRRNYAIHGIQSSGAFHPKVIFLAGDTSILILIGSGNLTTSGHGKNLESWNPVYVDNLDDDKTGFAKQCWDYIKYLHEDLGNSAQQKIKSIEENCLLLSNLQNTEIQSWYSISESTKISFLSNFSQKSIFSQISESIGEDTIRKITIMSPYYDIGGRLIQLLNERFSLSSIHIILQKEFGMVPIGLKPDPNMHFYEWEEVKDSELRQKFFHAKNIVFEGKRLNYLLTGSANASMAALVNGDKLTKNHEVCVMYQDPKRDFVSLLGLNVGRSKVNISDYKNSVSANPAETPNVKKIVFIKAIEKDFDIVSLNIQADRKTIGATLLLLNSQGIVEFNKEIDIPAGTKTIQVIIPNNTPILCGAFFLNDDSISNKQFVIDVNAFEATNPSPRNRSLNQIRKLIEGGTFSTQKIIEYLSTIYRQKELKKPLITRAIPLVENKDDKITEEETELLYMSYEEIQNKAKKLENVTKGKAYLEYKGVRLWESIFSYLKEVKQKEEEAKMDEEETEDINSSSGRKEAPKKKEKSISKSNFESLKIKVEKFLGNYQTILESKIDNTKADKPNLIDLCMYLIILEILMHLYSHFEVIEESAGEKMKKIRLIPINYQWADYSWSDCIIKFVGLFALWCSQKKGFKKIEGEEYKLKLELYKMMAFKSTISALTLFDITNCRLENPDLIRWKDLCLLNADRCFNPEGKKYKDVTEFDEYIPKETKELLGEYDIHETIISNSEFIQIQTSSNANPKQYDYYLQPEDGFTFVEKIVINPRNEDVRFLKLFHPGYAWDESLHNYWNGKLFSLTEKKWLNARKD